MRLRSLQTFAHVVFYDLQYARTAKPLKWLGLIVLFPHLREVQREAKDINHVFGHGEQILF
jgi:hypothetical protein